MKRSAAVVLVVLVTAVTLGSLPPTEASRSSADVQPTTDFHQFPCPDGAFPDDRDVECGFIEVPEDRSHPEGRQIKVAAAIVRATSPTPAPDPIVFVNGGPSVGAIQPFALEVYFAGASYADDHDLVLVDTRGTGISRPRLGCRELDRADVLALYAGSFANDRAPQITGRALDKCWERLTERGLDLASYNSAESAADLDELRQALGVDQWNLFALSGDGVLGLTYLRLFPEGIRSAVIDSGVSSNALWGLDYLHGETDLVNLVLAGCRANAACDAAYPGLRRAFFRLVRRLNEHPIRVPIPDFQPEPITLEIDGGTLGTDLAHALWPGGAGTRGAIHQALDIAWTITHGGLRRTYRQLVGTGPYENEHANQFFAKGKSMSYICHDLIGFISMADRRQAAAADPVHARRVLGHLWDLGQGWNNAVEGCRHWPVGRAAPAQHEPIGSDVPTLVLSGAYDVIVPPRVVERMLPGLAQATYVEMPTSTHGILTPYTRANRCARRITRAFLTTPGGSPDTSCVGEIRPINFTPPDRPRDLDRGFVWRRGEQHWWPQAR